MRKKEDILDFYVNTINFTHKKILTRANIETKVENGFIHEN